MAPSGDGGFTSSTSIFERSLRAAALSRATASASGNRGGVTIVRVLVPTLRSTFSGERDGWGSLTLKLDYAS